MSNSMLITRPKYDDATEYLSAWSKPVITFAKNKGIKVHDLSGKKANKKEIENFLQAKNSKLVFFNGHGSEETIAGQNGEIIISEKNAELLKTKIIYARACHAGKKIGKDIVKQGAEAFIGYEKPFSFFIDERWSAKPLNDKLAALFLEPSNQIITSLLKGNTARESFKKSREASIKIIKKFTRSTAESGSQQIAWIMFENITGQVLIGNDNALVRTN